MKLQQLKYLLAIVDNGLNITAAAEQTVDQRAEGRTWLDVEGTR